MKISLQHPLISFCFFLICFTVIPFCSRSQHKVSNIIPRAVKPGDTLAIVGTGFGNNPSIVELKLQTLIMEKITITDTLILAKVPLGASFGKVEVLKNGLTASSGFPVLVSRLNGFESDIVPSQFVGKATVSNNDSLVSSVLADFDNDGLIDVVAASGTRKSLVIYKNTSVGNNVSFSMQYPLSMEATGWLIEVADFNADGKTDIIASSAAGYKLYVWLNSSQSGVISFSSPLILSYSYPINDIVTTDVDGDGKIDFVVADSQQPIFTVFKNATTGNSLIFFTHVIPVSPPVMTLAAGDIDKDGREDLIAAGNNSFSVLMNTTSGGIPAYSSVQRSFSGGIYMYETALYDCNADGWLDFICAGLAGPVIYLYSPSSPENLKFQSFKSFQKNSTGFVVNADFNADHLPDFLTNFAGNAGAYYVGQNNYTSYSSNNLIFTALTTQKVNAVGAADFNNDGLADILLAGSKPDMSILLNLQKSVQLLDFSPKVGGRGTKILLTGGGFQQVTGVSFGNVPCDSFRILSASSIEAYPAAGDSGAVKLFFNSDSVEINGFSYIKKPILNRFTPDTGYYNSNISIIGQQLKTTQQVSIGSTIVSSFIVVNDTLLQVKLDSVNSGAIKVTTLGGVDSLAGFVYYPRPRLYSTSSLQPQPGSVFSVSGKWLMGIQSISLGGVPNTNYNLIGDSIMYINVPPQPFGGYLLVVTKYGRDSLSGFYNGPEKMRIDEVLVEPGMSVRVKVPNLKNFGTATDFFINDGRATIIESGNDYVDLKVPFGKSQIKVDARLNGMYQSASPSSVSVSRLQSRQFDNQPFDVGVATPLYFLTNKYKFEYFDIDGDGFTDILGFDAQRSSKLMILRSKGIPGMMAFDTVITNIASPPVVQELPLLADLDNNGRKELLVYVFAEGTYCYENISTPGNINFINRGLVADVPIAGAADFDGDGWQDLIAVTNSEFYCYRNQSATRVFQFGGEKKFIGFSVELPVLLEDINYDGKTDLMFKNTTVFTNSSIPGQISFEWQGWAVPKQTDGFILLDADNDGKKDIVANDRFLEELSIYKNSSTPTNLSFTLAHQVPTSIDTYAMAGGDVNGDGKADVCLLYVNAKKLIIVENTSSQNDISFSTVAQMNLLDPSMSQWSSAVDIALVDLDADGYMDLTSSIIGGPSMLVYRNIIDRSRVFNQCVLTAFSLNAATQGSTYRWQLSTNGGAFIDLQNDARYSGVNNPLLSISGLDDAAYGYVYRCIVDNEPEKGTAVIFRNTFLGTVNNDWNNAANWSCGSVPSGMVDVIINKPVNISSNISIRSITILPGGSVTIVPGVSITLLK